MLSSHATNSVNAWMTEVVVIEHNGDVQRGLYDGYGRVCDAKADHEIHYGPMVDGKDTEEPCCWHAACWDNAGRPMQYDPSRSSKCQGFFFNDEHDMPRPTTGRLVEVITEVRVTVEVTGADSDEDAIDVATTWLGSECPSGETGVRFMVAPGHGLAIVDIEASDACDGIMREGL